MEFVHKSVLLEESINWLITDKDGILWTAPWVVRDIPKGLP